MKERAYAKINLCLDVVGKRDDGYHELKMVMVPLDFYDVLEMVPSEKTQLSLNRYYLPVNDKNTVIKAIQCVRQRYGFSQEFSCTLTKHIPTQAGLAGGSADAAAAIRILNRMLHLNMDTQTMLDIGREVGADVPFCCLNRPALVKGIGEQIEPFKCSPSFHVLLVKPGKGVSTKTAFSMLDYDRLVHPDCLAMCRALIEDDYAGVIQNLGNSIEESSLKLVPEIKNVKDKLVEFGFDGVLMSGSGSTVFGLTKDKALLKRTAEYMHNHRYFVRITDILSED